MSSARPVSVLEACDDSVTSRQSGSNLRTANIPGTTRSLEWWGGDARTSHVGTSARPWWLWPNLLSLDAPLIAVLWLNLFAAAGHIRLSPLLAVALGLVVWLIYVGDRLLDGLQGDPRTTLSARHQFYSQHRNVVSCLLLAGFIATCWVCLQLNSRILEQGTLLTLVVAAYFVVVHRTAWSWRFPKEIFVALVFGIGTVFPAWSYAKPPSLAMGIDLVLFTAICWINLVLIEHAEWVALRHSRSDTPHPSTITAGRYLTAVAVTVACVTVLAAWLSGVEAQQWILLSIAMSALALAGVGHYRRQLSINVVRVLADAAMLTPAIALLFLYN